MKAIIFHHAIDRRCYYGAPSYDLQKEIKSREDAIKQLDLLDMSITYFPNGEFYVGFKRYKEKAPEIITPDCASFESCYYKIISFIEGEIK